MIAARPDPYQKLPARRLFFGLNSVKFQAHPADSAIAGTADRPNPNAGVFTAISILASDLGAFFIRLGAAVAVNQTSYEDGLREGRLRGIEETVVKHGDRLDKFEIRLTSQERISYALLGAVALLNILPILRQVI